MNSSEHRYSHRGDGIRRSNQIRKAALVVGLVVAVALIPRQRPQNAEASSFSAFSFGNSTEAQRLRAELDAAKGELALTHAQLERAKQDYLAATKGSSF